MTTRQTTERVRCRTCGVGQRYPILQGSRHSSPAQPHPKQEGFVLTLCPHRCQGLHPCCGSGQGPYRCFEEAQGELWLQGMKAAIVGCSWGCGAGARPGPGSQIPGGAKKGPGPFPLVKETDLCPLSSSQIYNLGTGTGYSVLQMVQAMEKASGRKVRSDPLPAGATGTEPAAPTAPRPRHPKPSQPRQPLCVSVTATGTAPSTPGPQMSPLC